MEVDHLARSVGVGDTGVPHVAANHLSRFLRQVERGSVGRSRHEVFAKRGNQVAWDRLFCSASRLFVNGVNPHDRRVRVEIEVSRGQRSDLSCPESGPDRERVDQRSGRPVEVDDGLDPVARDPLRLASLCGLDQSA